MSYVYDTSGLVAAWNRLYPPGSFPSYWERVDKLVEGGRLRVPQEVFNEIKAQDDALYAWTKQRAEAMVVPTTRPLLLEVAAILADHERLTMPGKGRGKADPFVIALAAQLECPVVTHEDGGTAEKPRIPYVCDERGVPCMGILDVIVAEGWQF